MLDGGAEGRERSESNEWLLYLSSSAQDTEDGSTGTSIAPPITPSYLMHLASPPKRAITQPLSSRDFDLNGQNHKLNAPNKTIAPSPNPFKACNLLDPDLCTRSSLLFPVFPFAFLLNFSLPASVTFEALVLLSKLEFEIEEVELLILVLLRLFRSELSSFEFESLESESEFEFELLLISFEFESEKRSSSRTKSSSRQELHELESWKPPKILF
jgi:hypothetical protein